MSYVMTNAPYPLSLLDDLRRLAATRQQQELSNERGKENTKF